jgi:L-ribulose-5-phosphate 3-epimerase UlaE
MAIDEPAATGGALAALVAAMEVSQLPLLAAAFNSHRRFPLISREAMLQMRSARMTKRRPQTWQR